ncbi:LysM peptidoglycan-binding domain-containing protein, partial [Syntrophorhabdus aromaticivorans]|uniref:LysM peptidoglycan-binding domain-containing protein n=1 Tax=Syntrophorhabdus aromaticivorans TaxID=328301 RepID=UPI0012EC46E3
MSEQNSMVMEFSWVQTSAVSELVKGAIKVGIETGALARSLATTFVGIKFSILGTVDKGLKVYVTWDSGNPDAVGKAVFQGVAGLAGAALGTAGGGIAGMLTLNPVVIAIAAGGTSIGMDLLFSYLAGEAWDSMSGDTRSAIVDFFGLTQLTMRSSTNTIPSVPDITSSYFAGMVNEDSSVSVYQQKNNDYYNVQTGIPITRDPDATEGNYTIVKGDNLWTIAMSNGLTLEQLQTANPQITHPDLIHPGQVINIPQKSPTHLFSLTNTTDFNPTLEAPIDQQQITLQVQANKLICNGVTVAVSLLGDVNTDPLEPGNCQLLHHRWIPPGQQH